MLVTLPEPGKVCAGAKLMTPVALLMPSPPIATIPLPTVIGESVRVKLLEIAGTWPGVALERKII